MFVDPTQGLATKAPKSFTGKTLTLDQQRRLFRRWTTDPAAHPQEALLGVLALFHGASSHEIRHLRITDLHPAERTNRRGAAT